MRSKRSVSILVGVVVALGALAFDPPIATAATDQLQDKAVKTYELQPDRGVVHVTTVFTLTNKAPSKTGSRTCSGYVFDPYSGGYVLVTGTCRTRTDYYYNDFNFWVENDAKSFKAKASSGTAKVKLGKKKGDDRKATLSYSKLFYGKTRRITVSYDLPAGGPRSTADRRVGWVYSSFCASGPGTDSGSLSVVVPAAFDMHLDTPMASKTQGDKLVYTSGNSKKPWELYDCFEGTNESGYTSTPVTTSDGRTVTVESWKEDATWADAVRAAVETDLPALTRVLGASTLGATAATGRGLASAGSDVALASTALGPGSGAGASPPLTIREEISTSRKANTYDATTGIFRLSEAAATKPDVTHQLTSLWFDPAVFLPRWMAEGYAAWAEHKAGVSTAPCSEPGTYPTTGRVNIADWTDVQPTSSQTDRDLAAYRKQAACYLISTVADSIGDTGTQATLATMSDGSSAFSTPDKPTPRKTKSLSWREWLDIVEQRGLIPADADPTLAATLLRTYGVTFDDATLASHATTIGDYRALQTLTGQPAPAAVTDPLVGWDYEAAEAAIAAASAAWTTAGSVETTLPGTKVDGGAVQTAVTGATSQADLDAAKTLADRQLTLATDAAAALAAERAPRDLVQELGLVGSTLPADAVAIDAVTRIDADAAAAATSQIHATLDPAHDTGIQRLAMIAGIVLTVLILLVLAFVLVRRRRRRALDPGDPGTRPSPGG